MKWSLDRLLNEFGYLVRRVKRLETTGGTTASGISVVPSGNLSSTDVQNALEELQGDIDGFVGGSGDMTKLVYDTDNDGIVDNSEQLNSQAGSYYLNRANHSGSQAASTISDFDTEVSNNTDVAANTSARHTHSNLAQLNLVTDGDHDVRIDNPHGVTKAQVGLSNVPNIDTTSAVANSHTHANQSVLDNITAAYTTAEQTKLSGIATGAEVNVNADWDSVSGDSQILNKPTIPTQYTDELAQDAVGLILLDSESIDFSYNDTTPTISASVIANTHVQKVEVSKNGSYIGARKRINLIEGSNITLTITDDSINDEMDITITSSGSSGISEAKALMISSLRI